MRNLHDVRPVDLGVIDAPLIAVAMTGLAEIGEVESAAAVENDVVRPLQRVVAATIVKTAKLAGLEIDPFDASAGIVCGRPRRAQHARLLAPLEAAVVADIERSVWPQG